MYFSCIDSLKEVAASEPKQRTPKKASTYVKSSNNIDEEFHSSAVTHSLSDIDSTVPVTFPSSSFSSSLKVFQYNSNKLTCKYQVQIEGDQDFKISRKIIGPKVTIFRSDTSLTNSSLGMQHEENHRNVPTTSQTIQDYFPKRYSQASSQRHRIRLQRRPRTKR